MFRFVSDLVGLKFNFCFLLSPQNIFPKGLGVIKDVFFAKYNGCHHGSLESQSLRNGFVTLSILMNINKFVFHLFL